MPDITPPVPSALEHLPRRRGVTPVLIWIGLAVLSGILLWLLPTLVMVILWATLLAVVLRGWSDWIGAHTGLPARLVLAMLTVAMLGGCVIFLYWIGPKLADQVQDLANRLGSEAGTLRQALDQTSWGRPIAREMSEASQGEPNLIGPAEMALAVSLRMFAAGIVLAVTALYFAISPEIYVDGLIRLAPIEHRARVRGVLGCVAAIWQRWILGQLVDMLTVGVLAAVGLNAAGVPAPYALASIAGLLTFIPYFGAIIAAIPALIVALSVNWIAALWTILIFLVCHSVEGYVVAPLIQRRLLNLPPAASILSMTIMGTLFGPIGIILGTPTAAAGLVLMREIYYPLIVGEQVGEA